ncbi:MAG: methylated-DNA--[protein]-cysteine S-methyltransferase [Verrucomicrobia bacterium]|nr:methylated-DNA--[protein]-cysteine S-methyltransferase [Verrucomicrobiota bacterium]
MWHRNVSTAAGDFVAAFSARGLCELHFPGAMPALKTFPAESSPPSELPRWLRLTSAALANVLNGSAPRELPPLDLNAGTAFQKNVWRALLRIPAGRVRTYGELAGALGKSGAARAVGTACGANPVPVLVPCHRVVAAGGGLGGFTAGLAWKMKLLKAEGVVV